MTMSLSTRKNCTMTKSLMPSSSSSSFVSLWRFFLFFYFASTMMVVHGKQVSGSTQLNGVQTEHLLGKFCLSKYAKGKLELTIRSKTMIENVQYFKLHLYNDLKWKDFTKAPTCLEKIKHAHTSLPLTLAYVRSPPPSPKNNKKRKKLESYQADDGSYWETKLTTHFGYTVRGNTAASMGTAATPLRPQYWYITLADCSLELYNHDATMPKLEYDLTLWNDVGGNVFEKEGEGGINAEMMGEEQERKKITILTHVSGDEGHIWKLHILTLFLSTLLVSYLGYCIYRQSFGSTTTGRGGGGAGSSSSSSSSLKEPQRHHQVHAALLFVTVAALCDIIGSLCELWHQSIYESNGIGSYALDAYASHMEAMCDSIVTILLLLLGAGWTLPTNFQATSSLLTPKLGGGSGSGSGSGSNATVSQKIENHKHKRTLVVMASVVLFHGILAQWGRTYDDDFDTYHSLEHLPGKILMGFRIGLGFLFMLLCVSQRNSNHHTTMPQRLQSFFVKLQWIGLCAWFWSLPCLAWMISMVCHFYSRQPYMEAGAHVVQSSSLVALAWLFTYDSSSSSGGGGGHYKNAFLEYSKIHSNNTATADLMELSSLSSSTTTATATTAKSSSMLQMGKVKIRVD